MIKKVFRLKEKQVKKVLAKGKPFFSYGIVLNFTPNKLNYNRFSIVIGNKSVNNNISRNFFRRRFFDFLKDYIFISKENKFYDLVFVVKKQNKLDKKNKDSLKNFFGDLNFLVKKFFN